MKTLINQMIKPWGLALGFIFFLLPNFTSAQNVADIGKDKAVKVSGSIGGNSGFYKAYGRESRRDPFFYLLNANINFNIYGVNVPFSAVFSQQETNFLQPFNQFGLSPYYKNLKIHLGFRSMNFSSFTLSGHTFLGAGFEFNPKLADKIQLRTGGMYGRLRRAVSPKDSLNLTPSYKRMGYSAKIGVGNGSTSFIDFILFKAKDDINSVDTNDEAFSNITPAENLVLGIVGEHLLANTIKLKFDYSSSAYTRDIRSNDSPATGTSDFYNNLGTIFTPRASSQFRSAIKAGIGYDADAFSVGFDYKRIDTDFRTLGAYYFLNDIEDYTATLGTKIFNKKMQVSLSGGWQRNNLNQEKSARATRFIASLALAYSSGKRWNFNINASNYSSFLTVVQDQFSDSSNVYQVSRNLNFSTDYLLVEKGNQQSIWANIGFQNGSFRDEYQIDNMETQFVTLSGGHRYSFRKLGLNLNTSATYTSNTAPGYKAYYFGPNLTVSKRLGKKNGSRVSYNGAYLLGYQAGLHTYNHLTNRVTFSIRLLRKHTLSFSTVFFLKKDKISTDLSYSEVKGNLGYRYSF